MQEKNELNDIILNKGASSNSSKKIVLAVATLGVILIVVVLLMNTLASNGTDNLPQAVLPPQPTSSTDIHQANEPLFEEVEVVEDENKNSDLDQIAQKLKEQSETEEIFVEDEMVQPKQAVKKVEKKAVKKAQPKKVAKKVAKKVTKKVVKKAVKKVTTPPVKQPTSTTKQYYIQVGSFSTYEPNKEFLKSITDNGFTYKYHKTTRNNKVLNKVLVGPFNNEKNARNALRTIRSSVEAGAFLVRI
jgi:DedD protein